MGQGVTSPQELGKQAAGYAAADLVKDGMRVGIGTGSTVKYFIERLAQRCQEGLRVETVSTSKASEQLATKHGIAVRSMDGIQSIDLTVDGADEIDPQKRMIKGGGGALLREKIVAASSTEMLVIVDHSKCVDRLGSFPLPVELVPFGMDSTIYRLQEAGFRGSVRRKEGQIYVTDNHNHIIDLVLNPADLDPETAHAALLQIPGVVDTGFFLGYAGRVVVGHEDATVEIRP
ncbi:MAG: ribose-5-phosphate isomerase RpiA [Chlamydiia bacterium]|nr:ribose-5-phosphate isomerase RpiA [Chlamydiia bacterium]